MFLSACSGLEATERRVPEAVKASASALVDEVMAGDVSAVREAFPTAEGPEFEAFVERTRNAVREGSERGRELVGAQVLRGGDAAGYNLAYEVETDAGFTVVSTTYTVSPGSEPELRQVSVEGSDSSLGASRRRLGMATRLIGLAFVLGLVLIGVLLFRRRKPAT